MPNSKTAAISSAGTGTGGIGSGGRAAQNAAARGVSNSLAWSRAPAPAAARCAWCEHRFDPADDRRTGRIRCAACGVATTSPWPSDAQLNEAYGDWYRPSAGRFAGLGDKVLRRTRAALAGRLDRILPPGPVLDVGAGDGTLVAAFVRRGREACAGRPGR